MNLTFIIIERFKNTEVEKYLYLLPKQLQILWKQTYVYDTDKLKVSPLKKLILNLNLVIIGDYASFVCEDRDSFGNVDLYGLVPENTDVIEKLAESDINVTFQHLDYCNKQANGTFTANGIHGPLTPVNGGFTFRPMHRFNFSGIILNSRTERAYQVPRNELLQTGEFTLNLLKVAEKDIHLLKYWNEDPLKYAEKCLADCKFEHEKHVGIPNKTGSKFTFVKLGKKSESLLHLRKRHYSPLSYYKQKLLTAGEIKRITQNRHCYSEIFQNVTHLTRHLPPNSHCRRQCFTSAHLTLMILTQTVTPKHNKAGIQGKAKNILRKLLKTEQV